MPIKGLTGRGEAFPVIGKFRKGAQKEKRQKEGREYETWGKELTYFRPDWAEGEEETARDFRRIYGDMPNGIRVLFPFDEIEKVLEAWKVAFTAGTMLGRSDGEFIKYLQDARGNVLVREWQDVNTGEKVPHPADDIAGKDFKGRPVKCANTGGGTTAAARNVISGNPVGGIGVVLRDGLRPAARGHEFALETARPLIGRLRF